MPNLMTAVPLDNFTQNGDTTLSQLTAAVAAVNGGNNPGVANPVRDPATGKLVKVELTFPESVAQQAVDAINGNPGVPVVVGACPGPLYLADLDDTAGIAYSGPANWGRDGTIAAPAAGAANAMQVIAGGNQLGALFPMLDAATYVDYADLAGGAASYLRFNINFGSSFGAGDDGKTLWKWDKAEIITLTLKNGQPVQLSIGKTLEAKYDFSSGSASAGLSLQFYLGDNGRLYWRNWSTSANAGTNLYHGVGGQPIASRGDGFLPNGYGGLLEVCQEWGAV